MSEELDDINNNEQNEELQDSKHVSGMYKDWFLDYASYVILERAVPKLEDGLKPVQRRILHSMKEMDDGRFNKVANVIGQTMQYHPHGDAAIGDAMVNLGQKDLLIETQGNWGDIRTGDRAAAPRYIEARLSKFALEIAFNAQTTEWQLSYDGRKKEPVSLPVKFPLILAQGVEGIAVGLATKIMPHNFCELIDGSIKVLQGKKVKLVPDFPTGGMADFSEYNGGQRGGKIKVRAKIDIVDKKTLAIRDVPYGSTTGGLIDSIIKANDKGKIKIKRVIDNTAKDVEVLVLLAPNTSPDITMDALYAFTDCETSISPNACVIVDDKPIFLGVDEMLRISTENTKDLLRRELEIKKSELEEKWHFSSLEKIFIENRVYRDIEEAETWQAVIEAIDLGLHKFVSTPSRKNKKKDIIELYRDITEEDIVRLTEIKIKRISKFDAFKADELITKIEDDLAKVIHDLAHLTDYAIDYFKQLLKKYGKGRERKTEIKSFGAIKASFVAANNAKLYVNRKEGFIGYGIKKEEFVEECSDLDRIITFRKDGSYSVNKIEDKIFVGKDILHVAVWHKGDEMMVYHAVYWDAKKKRYYVKRFNVNSVTMGKPYDVTKGAKGSKLLYFSVHPNGESEIVKVQLTLNCKAREKEFDFDFGELAIKGRGAGGNILTKHPIKKVTQKSIGESTIGGRDIWLDKTIGKLNTETQGEYLGQFIGDDGILVIKKDGSYQVTNFEPTNHYDMQEVLEVLKLDKKTVISSIYYDGDKNQYFIKRFKVETTSVGQQFSFITEHPKSKLILATTNKYPRVLVKSERGKSKIKEEEEINVWEFIDVKGWKSLGNRLSLNNVKTVKVLDSLPEEENEKAEVEDDGNNDEGPDNTPRAEAVEPIVEEVKKPAKNGNGSTAKKETPKPDKPKPKKTTDTKDAGIDVGGSIEWDIDTDETKISDPEEQGSLF